MELNNSSWDTKVWEGEERSRIRGSGQRGGTSSGPSQAQ